MTVYILAALGFWLIAAFVFWRAAERRRTMRAGYPSLISQDLCIAGILAIAEWRDCCGG